jgi:hypothetical protein
LLVHVDFVELYGSINWLEFILNFCENHGTIIITCHYGSIIINTQKGMSKQFLNEKNSSGVLENQTM